MVKTVFITGANGGFGSAIAQKFADNGWQLILQVRSQAKADDLIQTLPSSTQYHLCICDLTDRDAFDAALNTIPSQFTTIDTLVNNAGLALGLDPAHTCDINDWDTMIDVNIKALTYTTRQILPDMVERQAGHIINIGSTAGNYPYPGGNVYCATKSFVKQFSLCLRGDLHGTGVRVTNLEPGIAETNFSRVRFKNDNDKADAVYKNTTALQGEDIANAVYWATSCPPHMNINRMEIMPTVQSFAPHPIAQTHPDT